MIREEAENVLARFMLNENVPLESVKEAILCAIKDMHTMIEIENILEKEGINDEKGIRCDKS